MPRYSEKQRAALDALMKDDVYCQAMEIITAEGLSALTMERLATDVGVARGTLYNYFTDRDAVVDYLEERTFAPVLAAIQELADGALPPDEKLSTIAQWIFTATYNDRALVVALVPNKHAGANRQCQERRHVSALAAVEAVVREGVEGGVFRSLVPELAAEIFLSAVIGMIDTMAFTGKFLPPDEVVPTFTELMLSGFRSASNPTNPAN